MRWDALVLREGDRVEAWGRLVRSAVGEFFDPPLPVAAVATPTVRRPHDPSPEPAWVTPPCPPPPDGWPRGAREANLDFEPGEQLGARLCVVESRFSRAEVDAVREELVRRTEGATIWSAGETCDDQGQPVVTVELSRVGPSLAAWLGEQPEGLLQVDVWLRPMQR